jgi:hypothetical protein
MAEQFRLQAAAAAPAAHTLGAGSWPPTAVAHPAPPTTPRAEAFDPRPQRGLWARVRRAFAGPTAAFDQRA